MRSLPGCSWASRCGFRASPVSGSRITSSRASATIRRIAAERAARVCGAIHGIPNYFFEWLHWFAYVALAAGSPLFWLSLHGTGGHVRFLRWISGIPFTEAQALRTRGEDYRALSGGDPAALSLVSKGASPLNSVNPLSLASPQPVSASPGVSAGPERGWLPDALIRHGIRRLCASRALGGICRRHRGTVGAVRGAPRSS